MVETDLKKGTYLAMGNSGTVLSFDFLCFNILAPQYYHEDYA